MWFFDSPNIVFGENAAQYLEQIESNRIFLVSDSHLSEIGLVNSISKILAKEGRELEIFCQVEKDPSLETVEAGAQAMLEFQPDAIVAFGGGSVMDAAKGMWVLYENPELKPEDINPVDRIELRKKARFIAVPTTAGTGSEATWAIVLTDRKAKRKLTLGNRVLLPDLAILEPEFIRDLPPLITAETGMDALTHAIEGYTSSFANDFSNGLCLQAIKLIFKYLPVSVENGKDMEARTHLQNAAAIAGLGFGNSMTGLAHGMGHSLGGALHIPHGRAVSICLPYTIEFCSEVNSDLYSEIVRYVEIEIRNKKPNSSMLARAVRSLSERISLPTSLSASGISRGKFEESLDLILENAMNDSQTIMSRRIPDEEELRALFNCVYMGKFVDF